MCRRFRFLQKIGKSKMEETKKIADTISVKELLNKAKEASTNSYSPYSKFAVGAACIFESGKIYLGSNIENVSYGLGLCAERNALSTALCDGEKSRLLAVAVYSPNQKHCLPCGACLQWLSEFSNMHSNTDIEVILEDGMKPVVYKLSELLPFGFKFD